MKHKIILLLQLIILSLAFPTSISTAAADEPTPGTDSYSATQTPVPQVTMNLGVEISGLGQAAELAAEGLVLIGESLNEIADKEELSPEQRERIEYSLDRIDQLSNNMNLTLDKIPGTLEKSMAPLVDTGNELADEIKLIAVIVGIILVLLILAAFAAIYYFVLTPATTAIVKTTGLLNDLADTLDNTARIVEKSSNQNLLILEEMRRLETGNDTPPDQAQ